MHEHVHVHVHVRVYVHVHSACDMWHVMWLHSLARATVDEQPGILGAQRQRGAVRTSTAVEPAVWRAARRR